MSSTNPPKKTIGEGVDSTNESLNEQKTAANATAERPKQNLPSTDSRFFSEKKDVTTNHGGSNAIFWCF